MHDIDNYTLSAIYNILTHYGHSKKITYNDYANMWNSFKTNLFINALIGQATQEDFSYFFVVGNKVFNIIDIVNAVQSGNTIDNFQFSINMAKVPRLNPLQKEFKSHNIWVEGEDPVVSANIRSKHQVDYIMKAHLQAGIKLKITQVK